MTATVEGFAHGDRVRDVRSGRSGRVRVFDLSPADRAEGCAEAEVAWDGSFVADEIAVAISNGLVRL